MDDRKPIAFLAGFFGAIGCASALVPTFSFSLLFFVCTLVLGLLSWRSGRFAFGTLLLLGAGLGFVRFSYAEYARIPAAPIVADEKGFVELSGTILDEPREQEDGTRLIVTLEEEKGNVYVTTGAYPRYLYGDQLKLSGKIDTLKDRDTGKIAPLYHDVFFVMNRPEIERISSGHGSRIIGPLLSVKSQFVAALQNAIPEPYASFGAGITLGARGGLPTELRETFNRTSTSHLIAVSGYNLTLVADAVSKVASRISIVFAPYISVGALLAFVLIAGASGSTLRAAVMALLLIFARRRGKLYDVTRAIVATAFILALINPHILFFDLSFQLSLLATVGIVYVAPLFEAPLVRRGVPKFFAEIISGTLAAELLVLPLILYSIGDLSLVGLPTNTLVLPFMGVVMALLFVTGFFGLMHPLFAAPFGFLSYIILAYQVAVIRFFGNLSFASVHLESVPFLFICALYLCIFLWVRRQMRKERELARYLSAGVTLEAMRFEIVNDEIPR